MYPKTIFAIIFLFLISLNMMGQDITVSGYVTDSSTGKPLKGVYVTDGKKGSTTDKEGKFTITSLATGNHTFRTMYFSSYSSDIVTVNLQKDTSLAFFISQEALLLEESVVTGTRSEKRLLESPVQTTVIRNWEMNKAGTVSTLEALQDNIPGIVVSPNGMGNNMRIKGLNTRYIVFLIDGERMVSEGAGGNINLDQIDTDNIERIEMVNGASSALYGSNAVGAVINIITKKPVHKIEAGANISAESHNTWRSKISVGSRLDRFSARASAFRNSSAGYGFDSGAYASPYEDWGTDMRLWGKPAERTEIDATARMYTHETFNPSGSLSSKHSKTYSVSATGAASYSSADSRNLLRASISYTQYLDFDVMEQLENKLDKQNHAIYLSARAVETFKPGEHFELISGMEYNREENFSVKSLGSTPTAKAVNDYNIFAQSDWEAFRGLNIVAGARYTYNSQFGSAFTPKLSLMYEIAGVKLRAGAGTAFRAPSIKELYYDFDHQGMFWVYGNPDLKAEKGLYTSLSAEYDYKTLNASVSGYYNRIGNKITQYDVINSSGANEKYYRNVSSATLWGFDINLSVQLFHQLVLKGTYSFCNATDDSTGLQLESNVKHSGTMSITWNGNILRSPFSLQIAARANSPKLYQRAVTSADGSQSVELSQSKAYNIWKIVFVKPFRINKHTIELTLKCDNVFNFKDTSFINPGRQFLAGIRYSFK